MCPPGKYVLHLFVSFEPRPAPSATAFDSPSPDPQARDAAYVRVLDRMMEVGVGLLDMVHHEAEERMAVSHTDPPPYPAPADDLSLAYERITRSVRRSIMLAKKLEEPSHTVAANHIAARKRIIREVEDAIQSEAAEDEDIETLNAELLDRLDSPDLVDEIANRTIPEIVTDICRDFGIAGLHGAHPWKRRMPHDIAILGARAAGLAVPASPKVDDVEQQRTQQAQRDPSEPETAHGAAQGRQQADTG